MTASAPPLLSASSRAASKLRGSITYPSRRVRLLFPIPASVPATFGIGTNGGAGAVPSEKAFLRDEPLGHVPTCIGRNGELSIQLALLVDGRHDAGRHVLESLEPVQRFGRLDGNDLDGTVASQPASGSHDRP